MDQDVFGAARQEHHAERESWAFPGYLFVFVAQGLGKRGFHHHPNRILHVIGNESLMVTADLLAVVNPQLNFDLRHVFPLPSCRQSERESE